jgi:nitrite reductase (NO-forming)
MTTAATAARTAAPRTVPVQARGLSRFVIEGWRWKGIGVLRIAFGLVWAVDAGFKWVPTFVDNFSSYLSSDNQSGLVAWWINLWISGVNVDPHVFAYVVAVAETLVAIGLILGLFSNLTYTAGSLLAVVIWSTAEGFGGPYAAGSTDIGAAIIYVFVFAALFLTSAGTSLGLDRRVGPRLRRLAFLASGAGLES